MILKFHWLIISNFIEWFFWLLPFNERWWWWWWLHNKGRSVLWHVLHENESLKRIHKREFWQNSKCGFKNHYNLINWSLWLIQETILSQFIFFQNFSKRALILKFCKIFDFKNNQHRPSNIKLLFPLLNSSLHQMSIQGCSVETYVIIKRHLRFELNHFWMKHNLL